MTDELTATTSSNGNGNGGKRINEAD